MQTLIYLHGFRSSSASGKCRLLGEALRHVRADWEYITPDLSHDSAEALTLVERMIARSGNAQNIVLIGSSLGGFYATVLAEKHGCRAVLLNPALHPHETLRRYVGEQTNLYTGETFEFTTAHLDALRAAMPAVVTDVTRYMIVVEMGDELLDHSATLATIAGARAIKVPSGNHNLDSFPQHIGEVLQFAGLADSEI